MKVAESLLLTAFAVLLLPQISSAVESADSLRCKAFSELRQRAARGDAKALYDLSRVYEDGYAHILPDTLKADSLLLCAAEAGYPAAQNYLGFKYYEGRRFPKDVRKALHWIQKAADAGDPKSFNNLGWMLMEGEGVERDFSKAAYWFGRAADAGLPVAMSQLADLYREGRGVPKDTLRAQALYEDAIRSGLADAQLKLLDMNRKRFTALPAVEALSLGDYYRNIGGVFPAAFLYAVAAEAGDADGFTLLGYAYARGEGVPYDYLLSMEYLWRGALGGNPSAQFMIGELLEMFPDAWQELPDEIKPDDEKKFPGYWLRQAALQGVTDADEASRRLSGRREAD